MSVRALSLVWTGFCGGSVAKLAMLALADCASHEGENVLPSMYALAEKISCPTSEAERVLCDLVAQGHVELLLDWHGRYYRLNLAKLASRVP